MSSVIPTIHKSIRQKCDEGFHARRKTCTGKHFVNMKRSSSTNEKGRVMYKISHIYFCRIYSTLIKFWIFIIQCKRRQLQQCNRLWRELPLKGQLWFLKKSLVRWECGEYIIEFICAVYLPINLAMSWIFVFLVLKSPIQFAPFANWKNNKKNGQKYHILLIVYQW